MTTYLVPRMRVEGPCQRVRPAHSAQINAALTTLTAEYYRT